MCLSDNLDPGIRFKLIGTAQKSICIKLVRCAKRLPSTCWVFKRDGTVQMHSADMLLIVFTTCGRLQLWKVWIRWSTSGSVPDLSTQLNR